MHSPEAFRSKQSDESDNPFSFEYEYKYEYESPSDKKRRIEKEKRNNHINANIVHLDQKKILNVPALNYDGFRRIMPTVESAIDKLDVEVLPITPKIKKVLSTVVAESTKIFKEVYDEGKNTLNADDFYYHPLGSAYKFDSNIEKWSDVKSIMESDKGVAIAPITSGFHGQVYQKGVVFNEALLMKGSKRDLAETSLHEMAHVVSGQPDYTEDFVSLMYELAKYFTKKAPNI